MRLLLNIFSLLLGIAAFGQTREIRGSLIEKYSHTPIEGAIITLFPSGKQTISDERGGFFLKETGLSSRLVISSIGHETIDVSLDQFLSSDKKVYLGPKPISLQEISVTAGANDQYRPISKMDIRLRGIDNSQEILRMVPGLFIGQHAGGGKAEQIFLRGFDLDHGTDINISVDGMPVNMVSHAHGQGYADLHFIIPELIDNVSFKKGTYYPEKGNFATTGFVDFKTYNSLPSNSIKVEAGMFNTYRVVGMQNLLNERSRKEGKSFYIASEFMHTKGYFDNPQDFNRFNVFSKYYTSLGTQHKLSVSASYFTSKWDASGQIPERAVKDGSIGYYGAIDPNEGGETSRTNLNALLTSTLQNGSYIKNQVFYSNYHFDLFSNFTFYKVDPINGDQIRQKEARNMFGYNGSYHRTTYLGKTELISEMGVNLRMDRTDGSTLARTVNRNTIITPIMFGDIAEDNLAGYLSETLTFNSGFSINGGVRVDYFHAKYKDRLNGNSIGKASASIVSPKLNFNYRLNKSTQFYISGGRGFHSNDTRVVVPQDGLKILPAAYGSDLGANFKPAKNVLVNMAIWYLWLDQEFVYVGDEGVVEPSGKSRRYGTDLSIRYQPLKYLYADIDFNYSKGRAVEEPKGANYLPLAPRFTSTGGLTLKTKKSINAALRYRYMGDRPANEDNSVVAKGYFILDAFVTYTRNQIDIGISVQNLFDSRWKETQFDTESRLMNEAAAVSEIHFTPGTPFFAKVGFTYHF